jgi:hypothetical protein
LTPPVGQLGNGVIDTAFRASNDHRAATAIDDVERGLASHAGAAADDNDLLTVELCAHRSVPFPDFFTCYAVLNVWLCGAETIGDRRAGLSEVKPRPLRGELSSPRSANHPG